MAATGMRDNSQIPVDGRTNSWKGGRWKQNQLKNKEEREHAGVPVKSESGKSRKWKGADDAEGEKRIHTQGLMSRILNVKITSNVNEQIYAWVKLM